MDGPRKTVLSIEDNVDIASLIRLVLRNAPIDLFHAENTEEAWPLLQQHPPDLILLDMMLPGVGGLDFLTALRQNPRFTKVPVVIVSVRADMSYRDRAQELGVARYLFKPFSPAALRQVIQQVLGITWKESGKLAGLPPTNV